MKNVLQKSLVSLSFLVGMSGSFMAQDLNSDDYCIDDFGNMTPRKLIWQEDFGTFTSATEYWTWDYSNLESPQKVNHSDGKSWTTCYGLSIPGATCDTAPKYEGMFTVAANVTSKIYGATDGTKWETECMCFNGKYPGENGFTFVPDHTYGGTEYGGMLMLNAGNEPDATIYSVRIKDESIEDKLLTAKCYINTFLPSPSPVKIYLRLTDVKNGNVISSETIVRDARNDGLEWFEASVSIPMEGDEILLEVVSATGGSEINRNGNDIVLDDIQLYLCSKKGSAVTDTAADDPDEIVNVYTITGALLKSNVKRSEALKDLKKGSYYIVGHEKIMVEL